MNEPSLGARLAHELCVFGSSKEVEWIQRAAEAFEHQLREEKGTTHREIVAPLCDWLECSPTQKRLIGHTLDLLQVAFDLADNLADREEDEARGRTYDPYYEGIPVPVRHCLPALLVSGAHRCMMGAFSPEASVSSAEKVHGVLEDMLRGQGLPRGKEKVALVSGAQARLLCLPFWLFPERASRERTTLQELERWAQAWGNSWEFGFIFEETGSPEDRELWVDALRTARKFWPNFGPFSASGPLSAERNLRPVC
jgi:hypothetical protein